MTETREDIEKWAKLPDEGWVAVHVPRFKKVQPYYVKYEDFLKVVLKQACSKFAPLAVIEARAKSIPSFAEKILRKRLLYIDPTDPLPPDPLIRITDLCGGRIITQTSDQVNAMCRFIEESFDIDGPNSEDVSKRLKPTEFGYRSVHYIVQINPDKLKAAGIALGIPEGILGYGPDEIGPDAANRPLKAEIQVRTLLEHAWADIGHEMTYKTEFKVPDRINRQFAAIAATLENTDREFGSLIHGLDEFKSNFGAYHTRDEVEAEIARLRIVLANCPDEAGLAARVAQLALAIGRHEMALEETKKFAAENNSAIHRVRGIALTELYADHPKSDEFIEGRGELEKACQGQGRDAETLCLLAESWAYDNNNEARKLFSEAIEVDAANSTALCHYLEFEIAHLGNNLPVQLTKPMIKAAMARCYKQIEGKVNLPAVWSSLAIFNLLLDEPFDALDALAHLICLCETPADKTPSRDCAVGRALRRMRNTLEHIRCISEKLEGFGWFERLLFLALSVRVKDKAAISKLETLASWKTSGKAPHFTPNQTILIISGGCAPSVKNIVSTLRDDLLQAADGLKFSIISGGTAWGMSGLAGDIAEASNKRIFAYGYLPRSLPRGVDEEKNKARFDNCFSSPGTDFTPLDQLQGWTDLVAAGVDTPRVKLLSYCGGRISRIELVAALALGARVGLVQGTAIPKERQFIDPTWQDHPNLIHLPKDAMTLRAFILIEDKPAVRSEFDKAAQHAHEEYLKSVRPKEKSLQPWKDLPQDLKLSCYHQVAYAEHILNTIGLGLRPITDPDKSLLNMEEAIGKEGVRRLAEMEHGRWNVERLLQGWRYDPIKNVDKKLSPSLIPWRELELDIQQYDLDAVIKLPLTFKEVGLEVYRLKDVGDAGRKD
jgi:ppGpp synthetase/RelA/SpoT-type nucleotidyltranferase